jgi:hypothetical protein
MRRELPGSDIASLVCINFNDLEAFLGIGAKGQRQLAASVQNAFLL